MCDFKINYDLRPYLPDLNIKTDVYNTCDSINNNTNINVNSTIFIFNINRPIDSIYNDPNYLLFGITNPLHLNNYEFPSLNFFSPFSLNNNTNILNYKVEYTSTQLEYETSQILSSIGYDLTNIDEQNYMYQILKVRENITSLEYKVLYFYFNFKIYDSNVNTINYNDYNNLSYYDNKKFNVLIYPYIDNIAIQYEQMYHKKYTPNQSIITNKSKFINCIDFDNREIIKYHEKIDYKYFENVSYTMNEKTNIFTLKNYTQNIKNYVKFINEEFEKDNCDQVINIGLNEISKVFFYSTDYNVKNEQTYTLTQLNNLHLNNNNSFSNQNNRYSYTMDKKISNINFGDTNSKKYSMYYYFTNAIDSTLYQQIFCYYLNFYYNIANSNSQNQMCKLNQYLLKIFLLINPKIIDSNYLISKVETRITKLFDDSNNLEFSPDAQKLELNLIGNILSTKIYYINKYKIEFEFWDESGSESENQQCEKKFIYIIILSVAFYNGDYFYISNLDETCNTPIAYVNFTSIEESVSLLPSVYSIQKNDYLNTPDKKLFFYNTMNSYSNDLGIKNYYWNINYSGKDSLKQSSDLISMYNFYDIIPNIVTKIKMNCDKYYNNVINVLKTKINCYISNFINIENNYTSYTHYINNIKKYINYATLYDENIIKPTDLIDNVKYIEYYEYFPKIAQNYLELVNNYAGKYSQVLIYPYTNANISSFEMLPVGKYIKFNYINYSTLPYPTVVSEIENFVKSIKSIDEMGKYYFSLFIKLPYNTNLDDKFTCEYNCDYLINSTYSMGIGNSNTSIYLVLTDINSIPFNFYSENNNNNDNNNCFGGVIFGIKLYNYNNFLSNSLKLQLVPKLYMTQYINLNEFVIIMENFSDYSDSNNVLWDINQTWLKIHNFDSLKEILLYDNKRFNSDFDAINDQIKTWYDKFNYKTLQILWDNKTQLNNLRYDIKILIYISNLFKIIKLVQKIYAYCEIVKINIIFLKYDNNYLIDLIKYNSNQVANLLEINYNLFITSGNFETTVYKNISTMCDINYTATLESINVYQTYCIYIINYSLDKIPSITNQIELNVLEITNIYHALYYKIFKQIIYENINLMIGEQIIYDIDNFTSNVNVNIFEGLVAFDQMKKKLLLDQVNAYLKSFAYNTTKIDELYNLVKLMNLEPIDYIVKNYYIYDPECYTAKSNIPPFKIVDFLSNTMELIEKLSINGSNPEWELYQKSIDEGIITYITNTINYFQNILNKIVDIYDQIIDIYDPVEIGNFYNLLGLFEENYKAFFNVMFQNKIDKFYEYSRVLILFDNLFYSCKEFLFYVCVKNDFINENTLFYSENIFINENLYPIIKIDVFYDSIIKLIQNIDNLVIIKEPNLTIIYLEKIKILLKTKPPTNNQTIIIINEMIYTLKEETTPNDFILYGSYYIIPYQDLLLLGGSFQWASFNFKQEIANVIRDIDAMNISIYESYYSNPEITPLYSQALNYSYLQTPYKYININNLTYNEL